MKEKLMGVYALGVMWFTYSFMQDSFLIPGDPFWKAFLTALFWPFILIMGIILK